MKTIWGINTGTHDASITVIEQSRTGSLNIEFAAHAERSSRIKNDKHLNPTVIGQALEYGEPDEIYHYEHGLLKRTRQIWAGQYNTAFNKPTIARQLQQVYPGLNKRIKHSKHHHSHAAAGYYTSPFADANVLVLDSIGEFETVSIWEGNGQSLEKTWSQGYPHSIGLWYSAMTQRIGLKPNEDEYILMGWAAIGDPDRFKEQIWNDFFRPIKHSEPAVRLKHNLHRGCMWWAPELNSVQDYADIAAGTQAVYERIFRHYCNYIRTHTASENLVVMGGCALNCVANSIAKEYFREVWIMPNPGDAGSSLGTILAAKNKFVHFNNPYLGYNISGAYPVQSALKELHSKRVVGVANGRAEFGPRALGNRSLFADPRGNDIKHLVNQTKRRQEFRPFAPVILEEHASEYFDGPVGPFMQFTSVCLDPKGFPAIAHYDNTSRVQTVNEYQHPKLHELLTRWYADTGCPMLLNTSLNIKGEPMVDTEEDAQRWHEAYGVKVFTHD
jgi:carbamoyltransferase